MRPEISRREFEVLSRLDLYTFARRVFAELNPGAKFVPGWYLELLAAKLMDLFAGRTKRLIINIPPRYLKSQLGSVAFPAWCLGHDPSAQIICVSYAQDLADKHSRDCRTVMSAPWYQNLFPTRLSPHRQAVSEFLTTGHGTPTVSRRTQF
jgi:hypothetical protein